MLVERYMTIVSTTKDCGKKENKEAFFLEPNIAAHCCNHCRCGTAINVAYSECKLVALGIEHAVRMRHTVICDLAGCKILYHIVS